MNKTKVVEYKFTKKELEEALENYLLKIKENITPNSSNNEIRYNPIIESDDTCSGVEITVITRNSSQIVT